MKRRRKLNPYEPPVIPKEGKQPHSSTGMPSGNEARPAETRNFIILVIYQALMRTGWIFKTESVNMPAMGLHYDGLAAVPATQPAVLMG